MKDFLNYDEVYGTFLGLFKEVIKDYGLDYGSFEDDTEEYTRVTALSVLDSMKRYVHGDTRISGNFANMYDDWEITTDFVSSEVKPWGHFRDIIESIDNETISDEDLKKFQTWALDWFFTAFGTYNLKYNFGNYISEIEYEREHEGAA